MNPHYILSSVGVRPMVSTGRGWGAGNKGGEWRGIFFPQLPLCGLAAACAFLDWKSRFLSGSSLCLPLLGQGWARASCIVLALEYFVISWGVTMVSQSPLISLWHSLHTPPTWMSHLFPTGKLIDTMVIYDWWESFECGEGRSQIIGGSKSKWEVRERKGQRRVFFQKRSAIKGCREKG